MGWLSKSYNEKFCIFFFAKFLKFCVFSLKYPFLWIGAFLETRSSVVWQLPSLDNAVMGWTIWLLLFPSAAWERLGRSTVRWLIGKAIIAYSGVWEVMRVDWRLSFFCCSCDKILWQKQLKREEVYASSLKSVVHYGREWRQQEPDASVIRSQGWLQTRAIFSHFIQFSFLPRDSSFYSQDGEPSQSG